MLTRAEINRTKHRVGKQKGGGTARHGARSAPLFVGGAKAMGPVSHSHEFDLPKKVKALGLRHALSSKAKAGSIVVLDEAKSTDDQDRARWPSSSASMGVGKRAGRRWRVRQELPAVAPATSPHVALLPASGLNVYDIMRSDKLVLTTAALKAIEERLA